MKKCGYCDSMIPETAKFCPNCGANQLSQIEGASSTAPRQTYLLLSIISIFFFLPCGVIATIFSVKAAKARTDTEYIIKAITSNLFSIASIVIFAIGIMGRLA